MKYQYKPGLSVCMIVKNEEVNIGPCIESIRDIANEFVIVDTGSTDNTQDIVRDYQKNTEIQLTQFQWCDDFSKARNVYLSMARYSWILQLDADERISKRDHPGLLKAISDEDWDSYRMIKRSYVNDVGLGWFIPRPEEDPYEESQGWSGWTAEPNDLLFRNHPGLKYRYCVHEGITHSLADLKYRAKWLDIPVHHFGRQDMSQKEDKYLDLVIKRCSQEDDADSWYNLGTHYDWKGRSDEAAEAFKEALSRLPNFDKALYGLGISYSKLQQYSEMAGVFEKLININPGDYDQAWANLIRFYYFNENNLLKSISYAEKALSINPLFVHARYAIALIFLRASKEEMIKLLNIIPGFPGLQDRVSLIESAEKI